MGTHLIIESMPNSVVVKSLSRQSWVVDIGDAGTTVADLKRRLEDMGACESVKQLVYRGTVLMDTERIDAEQISDGFLVMLAGSVAGVPKPAVEQQDGQGAQREANSAESCVESFWTGHDTLRVGDPCMAAWPSADGIMLEWHPARVAAFDKASGLATVKWETEGSFTRGIEPKYIRACCTLDTAEDVEPAAEHPRSSTAVNLPVDQHGDLVMPPPEQAQNLLNVAMQDPQFHEFLQSPEFATMFEPLKQMVANQPQLVPEMVANMRQTNPHMAALVAPFLLAELEVVNPEAASAASAACVGK